MSKMLLISASLGFASSVFAFEGTLLLAPILIFTGVPPTTAVTASVYQILGTSVATVLSAWRTDHLNVKLGLLLTLPGIAGSVLGAMMLGVLILNGYITPVILVGYVMFLGTSASLMLIETVRAHLRLDRPDGGIHRTEDMWTLHAFPNLGRRTGQYAAVILSGGIGTINSILGVAGDFLFIYLFQEFGLPIIATAGAIALRNSLVSGSVIIAHSYNRLSVDVVLGTTLIIGAMLGSQLGTLVGDRLQRFRLLLPLVLLGLAAKFAFELTVQPIELYKLSLNTLVP